MSPREAVLAVLRDAKGPLHRTAIQDRALRAGYLDQFQIPDVRTDGTGCLAPEGFATLPA